MMKNYLLDEDSTLEGLPFDDNSLDLVVSSLGEDGKKISPEKEKCGAK